MRPGEDENVFGNPLHPLIKAEFDTALAQAEANSTVSDACARIIENSGWGPREEMVMRSATIKDFEDAIRTLPIPELRQFMRRFVEMRIQKTTYEKYFGFAMDHFAEACRNLSADVAAPRLANLIKTVFKDAKLEADLLQPVPQPQQVGPAREGVGN